MILEPIKKFIEVFSRLPSLGPRMATRLAFYLMGLPKSEIKALEDALHNLQNLSRCPQCFFIKTSLDLCSICSDSKRDKNTIAIVEKETDLLSLEKTGKFNGNYLIFGGFTDRGTLDSAQRLRLEHLKNRVKKDLSGRAKEIILALNPNSFGDLTALLIKKELGEFAEKITRLGRGIPTGGEIEFADEETLSNALENRS